MIRLTVNGAARSFRGHPFTRLIDVLREGFALTGTKEGCGEGECGACTVLLDGRPVMSCLVPIGQVAGRRVETIEVLGGPERLAPLQQVLLEEGGAQCGICTPGMVMAARAWVKGGGSAETPAIREALAGNLCRCTGYQHIVDAVGRVVREASRSRSARKVQNPGRRTRAKTPTSRRKQRRR